MDYISNNICNYLYKKSKKLIYIFFIDELFTVQKIKDDIILRLVKYN